MYRPLLSASAGTFVLFLCLTVSIGTAQETSESDFPAIRPEVQTAEWAQSWWMPRHEEKLKLLGETDRVDLLMIGDSITHGWENAGQEVWEEFYADRHPFNIGFSGDRTEQVIWRLQNGEIEGITPKLCVIMIGTNNTGHRQDPADQTAAGVEAIIEELNERTPDSKILLLAIFPRGETADDALRRLNDEINEKLSELANDDSVTFLDISDSFLDDDGTLPKSIMPDLLHPNAEGYKIWAESMEPTIARLMDE